jgi:PLP dependent protein
MRSMLRFGALDLATSNGCIQVALLSQTIELLLPASSPHVQPLDQSNEIAERIVAIQQQIQRAQRAPARLVAVSKTKPAALMRAAYAAGQHAFGENYVQEALAKQQELKDLAIEWHLLGPLQSNKCEAVAQHFDWLQSLDRAKLVPLLAAARPAHLAPLQVLIQVNIDDEASKSGCTPAQISELADLICAQPKLQLRGLMAIPKPGSDAASFIAMAVLFRELQQRAQPRSATIDTLSMGMSDDFPLALAHGATLVRVGSAIFGAR